MEFLSRTQIITAMLAVALALYVLDLVRRRRLAEEYSLLWVVASVAIAVLGFSTPLLRAVTHALTTAKYICFDGSSGQTYDVRGRTSHEAIFNRNDGQFRCRGTQQGYSPFSTWTRGLAWAVLGFAEQAEFLAAATQRGWNAHRIDPALDDPIPQIRAALRHHRVL